jgi:hypothetical protein
MSYLKIGKYYGESLTANTYQFKTVLDTDYADISDISMWFGAQEYADIDYTFAREGAIGYMMAQGGFSALTENDKITMARNYCVDQTDRDSVLTQQEQESYWELFIYNSENARTRRWSIAKAFISFRLDKVDGNDLGEATDILTNKFLRYDITSYSADSTTGLFDWLNDSHIYSGGTGFSSKSYYTSELRDGILDRLKGKVISTIQETPTSRMVKPSDLKQVK